MQIRSTIIVLVVLFCWVLTGVLVAEPEKASLTANQISDHSMTEGNTGNGYSGPGSLRTSGGKTHAVWIEETGSSEGSDLFYRNLSTNSSTINLSDPDQSEGTAHNHYKHGVADDGLAHVLWFEESSINENNLFYWHSTLGTIQLTSRAQASGELSVSDAQMMIDSSGKAQIVWRDFSQSAGNSFLYYWHDSTTTQLVTDSESGRLELGIYQEIAHVLWQKGETLYHWNSDTAVTDTLPTPVSADIQSAHLSVDNNGKAHVIWDEDASDSCFYYWDSVTKRSKSILSGVNCGFMQVKVDVSGLPYTSNYSYNAPNYLTYFWNPTMTAATELASESANDTLLVSDGGKAHLYYKTTNKVWYWNSDMAAFQDLSALAGTSSAGIEVLETEFNSQGNLHLVWWQDGLFYWDSGTAVVTNLSSDFFDTTNPDPTDMISEKGVIHFVAANNGEIKHWNSQTKQTQLISDLQGYLDGLQIVIDRLGQVHIGWDQSLPSSGHDMFYWNEVDGRVELNETAVDETSSYGVHMTLDTNNLHLLWNEDADITSEGRDVFVATIKQEFEQIFLPMLIR